MQTNDAQEAPRSESGQMNVRDIEDLWFRQENAEGNEADIVAYVKLSGVWYEAIRERMDVNFSRYSSAEDLLLLKNLGFLMKLDAATFAENLIHQFESSHK
jgi:hypothetical protein